MTDATWLTASSVSAHTGRASPVAIRETAAQTIPGALDAFGTRLFGEDGVSNIITVA